LYDVKDLDKKLEDIGGNWVDKVDGARVYTYNVLKYLANGVEDFFTTVGSGELREHGEYARTISQSKRQFEKDMRFSVKLKNIIDSFILLSRSPTEWGDALHAEYLQTYKELAPPMTSSEEELFK